MEISTSKIEKPIEVKVGRYTRVFDYFVDLFGIFLPGISFFAILLLLISGLIFQISCCGVDVNIDLLGILSDFKLEFSIVSMILSYVWGFLFFRKGTKKPDLRSAVTIWENIADDNPAIEINCVVNSKRYFKWSFGYFKNFIKNPKKYTIGYYVNKKRLAKRVEWPYEYLKRYLQVRLPHLSELIPWDPRKRKLRKATYRFSRSKHFMNVVKESIRFYMPEKYFVIARNEAHVRLSSSVWYAASYLIYLSLIAFAISLFLYNFIDVPTQTIRVTNTQTKNEVKKHTKSEIKNQKKSEAKEEIKSDSTTQTKNDANEEIKSEVKNQTKSDSKTQTKNDAKTRYENRKFVIRSYMVFCVVVYICSLLTKREIQKFLFYQRVREIIFILNIAYQARKIDSNFGTEFLRKGIWPLGI